MATEDKAKPTLRKAVVSDTNALAEIINNHAKDGVMLQRPLSRIYDNIRDYTVIEIDGEIVGCGALHVMWEDLAEIRAVALRKELIGTGLGRPLIEMLVEEARQLGVEKVFVLTYRDGFFRHLGFDDIDKSELPHKIWADCVNCVHFPNCDEISLIRKV